MATNQKQVITKGESPKIDSKPFGHSVHEKNKKGDDVSATFLS